MRYLFGMGIRDFDAIRKRLTEDLKAAVSERLNALRLGAGEGLLMGSSVNEV